MPVAREFTCDFPDCQSSFKRIFELDRHKRTHRSREEWEFRCPYDGCDFRANQKGGLKTHVNSKHLNVRLPCGVPGCVKTFSDPSGLTRHRQNLHPEDNATRSVHRSRGVTAHANVDANGQFATSGQASGSNATLPSSLDPSNVYETRPLHCPPVPSSSTYRPPDPLRSTHREHPGGFYPTDVQTDCWSIDQNTTYEHQAYNANHEAAPTPCGYYRDAPGLSSPPQEHHPPQPSQVQEDTQAQGTRDESCPCSACRFGGLTLPLRGHHQEEGMMMMMQGQPQSEVPVSFSYPRARSHVPPSDRSRWTLPPIPNEPPPSSTVYLRPNPGMLFGF